MKSSSASWAKPGCEADIKRAEQPKGIGIWRRSASRSAAGGAPMAAALAARGKIEVVDPTHSASCKWMAWHRPRRPPWPKLVCKDG